MAVGGHEALGGLQQLIVCWGTDFVYHAVGATCRRVRAHVGVCAAKLSFKCEGSTCIETLVELLLHTACVVCQPRAERTSDAQCVPLQ